MGGRRELKHKVDCLICEKLKTECVLFEFLIYLAFY